MDWSVTARNGCAQWLAHPIHRATLALVSTSTQADSPQTTSTGGEPPRRPAFVTTHWSVVVTAGRSDTPRAQAALERLCQTYWYPLYAFVRRRGYSIEDAQDLTQEFFARLLAHNWVVKADRCKGRFRSFLLMAMNRFLANEWDAARTQKRGGGARPAPLALETAETRYAAEPATTLTPELEYDKQWALTLIEEVLRRLRDEYEQEGKASLFDEMKPCLIGSRDTQPYATLAARLGMTEGAVKTAVCRLRQRYRERLKEEIANTVAAPEDADEELRHLFRVLARH